MVLLEAGQLPAGNYFNILDLKELGGIKITSNYIELGALTTYTEIQEHKIISKELSLLTMAAKETVRLAERILADHRSELKAPEPLADMVRLLDLFAKTGWPDALRVLWRLDEVFR